MNVLRVVSESNGFSMRRATAITPAVKVYGFVNLLFKDLKLGPDGSNGKRIFLAS
jgi:hypothetical protein